VLEPEQWLIRDTETLRYKLSLMRVSQLEGIRPTQSARYYVFRGAKLGRRRKQAVAHSHEGHHE
jgi:hypothetical protein